VVGPGYLTHQMRNDQADKTDDARSGHAGTGYQRCRYEKHLLGRIRVNAQGNGLFFAEYQDIEFPRENKQRADAGKNDCGYNINEVRIRR